MYICTNDNNNTKINDMTYSETLKIEKQIKRLDNKKSKLYKEYQSLESKQDNTNDEDMYLLLSQKMETVNNEIMKISENSEILSDSIN